MTEVGIVTSMDFLFYYRVFLKYESILEVLAAFRSKLITPPLLFYRFTPFLVSKTFKFCFHFENNK